MMKRFVAVMLLLACLLPCAMAEEIVSAERISVGQNVITLVMPEVGYCLTRESTAEEFAAAGKNIAAVEKYMVPGDIYLWWIGEDQSWTMSLASWEADVATYDNLNDSELQQQADEFKAGYLYLWKAECTVNAPYHTDLHSFVYNELLFPTNNGHNSCYEYITAHNGMMISITLVSYSGDASDELQQAMKDMVDAMLITSISDEK